LSAYYFCLSLSGQRPGTAVLVIGTISGTTESDPLWECFVDNDSIGSIPPIRFPENNWILCEADSLADASHTINLRATAMGQTLWFDRIEYSPSSSVNLDSFFIRVNSSDPSVTYGPAWQNMRDSKMIDVGKMTLQQGAYARVDFSGKYISCMGQKSGLQ
jgi:hypothetical protein